MPSNQQTRTSSLYENLRQFLFKNTADTQTVSKNTVWLFISNFGGRFLKAFVIIAAARILDPAGWGVVSYIVSLAGFFTFFVDPGVNVMLMREGSKKDEAGRVRLLSTTFYIKIALIAFAVIFVLGVGPLFSILPGAVILLPIAALIIVGDTLREFFSSFIRAKEKMEWEAGIFLLTNFFIVFLGFAALIFSPSAWSFGWAYAIGTTIGALAALWVLRDYVGRLFTHFSSELVMPILRSAWPFAITGALGVFLTNADILILSWMRSATEVGIYSAAIRIIQVLYLFPVIIQYSTLPLLARLAGKDNRRFREILERAIVIIFAVSIPLAFGGLILSGEIMKFAFGSAYAAGGMSLMLLMISMIVDYPGGVISLAIFAYDKQKTLITASVIGAVANVGFDLILIPRFGMTGSAWATLIAQILNNVYLWYVMKRINYFSVLSRLKKMIVAGILMTAVSALLLFLHVHVVLNIIVSVAIYCLLLKLFGDPLIRDLKRMINPPKEDAAPTGITSGTVETDLRTRVAPSVLVGKTVISVEIARDIKTIRKGLADRDSLQDENGMIFVFPKLKSYRSWMQGMRFPIDIIWLDKTKVVGLAENVQPPTEKSPFRFYKAPVPARYMLEVNAGFAKKNGIKIGDPVLLRNVNRKFTIIPADKAGFDKTTWNVFVERNYPIAGAFLETWEWGEFQKALGHRTERYVVTEHVDGVSITDSPVAVFTLACYWSSLGLQYGYLPRGPVVAKELIDEEARHFAILKSIKCWAKKSLPTLAFLRIEPPFSHISPDNAWHGFRTPSYYIQPPHNTLVSLSGSEAEIQARFHPSTRSNIRRAERRGVTCVIKATLTEDDVNHFFSMIRSTVSRNHGKNAYPDEHYLRTFLLLISSASQKPSKTDEKVRLKLVAFCGYQNGEPAATHIAVFFGNTATYLFGASYADKLNSKVETYLHWTAMMEAKRQGVLYYDLGGIDEKIWPSLTEFKRQFGGEELHYIGNLDIPLRPVAYHLYNFFKKTAKRIRRQG